MRSQSILCVAATVSALALASPAAVGCEMHTPSAQSFPPPSHGDQTLVAAQVAQAHGMVTLGDLVIEGAFSRASAPMAQAGAAFMTITNTGDIDDTLIDAETDASMMIELHTHIMDGDGVMRMREVEGGIPIPAGDTVTLEPGGLHVMLMGLTGSLEEGTTYPLTLVFEEAGSVEVMVNVGGIAASGPGGHSHRH